MLNLRTKLVTAAAVVAAAAGGATFANAATSPSASSTPSSGSTSRPQQDPSRGGHQANGKTETLLTGDTAAKVKAAALAKVPGTVERVETNVDSSAPYEAHVTKADGTQVEVQVTSDYKVSAVNEMGGMHP